MSDARRPTSVPIPSADFADRARAVQEASFGSSFSYEPFIPNPHPLIIVISGPSGAGKDAVINGLRQARENIHFVVTATSRGKRPVKLMGKITFLWVKKSFLE